MAKVIVEMWYDISPQLYNEDFEAPLLHATRQYYDRVAQHLIANNSHNGSGGDSVKGSGNGSSGCGAGGAGGCSCAAFFAEVERRLGDEDERVDHYLRPETKPKLVQVVQQAMLGNYMEQMLADPDTGLRVQLLDDEVKQLERQYRLLSPPEVTGGAALLSHLVAQYLTEFATATVTDPSTSNDSSRFVSSLLSMQGKFKLLLDEAFHGDTGLTTVLYRCLGNAINLRSVAVILQPLTLIMYGTELYARTGHTCVQSSV